MKSLVMKSVLLMAMASLVSTASSARWPEYAGFWVIGNRATSMCEIVTANPVLPDSIFWFQSGPYRSLDDARLAQSTIGACPKPGPSAELGRNGDE